VETIIAEIAENFIKNICEKLTSGKNFSEIEENLLEEAKNCASELVSAYAEAVDEQLLAAKSERKTAGYTVQRRGDERRLQTRLGEVAYRRAYYKKASGGYEYLTDAVLGVESRERVSEGLSLSLANAAKDMSYAKSSKHVADGAISRQTVMGMVRRSEAVVEIPAEKRCVPELHIDADEAHITTVKGKKREVPLISIYEGIEQKGKRNRCKNVFHISEYGKKPDDLWEQALTEIEKRYDLTGTKIYLHGDGANWIQSGLEWLPNACFVLDKYHKNKAIKAMAAGLSKPDRKIYDREIRFALSTEEMRFFDELTGSLCRQLPERAEKIVENACYLSNFVGGISICERDPGANNGGCTEPHVSHVLAARLSSRPMAWSRQTLQKLAPVLAAGKLSFHRQSEPLPLPVPHAPWIAPLRKAAVSVANKGFRRGVSRFALSAKRPFPHPNAIGTLPISGKTSGLHKFFLALS